MIIPSILPEATHLHRDVARGEKPLERRGISGGRLRKFRKVEEMLGRTWTLSFGRNVRFLRELKNLSQAALAKEAKVSVETVRNWEIGPNAPTPQHLAALAASLGVAVERLWERAVLLVPEFDIGVHCFPSPPVIERESLIVEPIMRKLKALMFDCYMLPSFADVHQALAELSPDLRAHVHEYEFKPRILEWAKEKRRALVMSSFRPDTEEQWSRYIEVIGLLKYDCCIVVIQAVDPFHVQPLLRTTSRYAAKVYAVDMNLDEFPPDLEELRRELPACCYRTILSVFDGNREVNGRECVAKLIESRVVAWKDGQLTVQYGMESLWRALTSP
jgi:transcriptional regulator with XRE-family HTH domain